MKEWKRRVEEVENGVNTKVGICGKYTDMDDSYASVEGGLNYAAVEERRETRSKIYRYRQLQSKEC